MRHWLLKSEPDTYSWSDLVREGIGTWDGVRNYMARNNLRAMRKGDLALFYHSVTGKEVVGICRVVEEHFPDPGAPGEDWSAVKVAPVKAFAQPVTLATIKEDPALAEIALLKYNRLSVVPLTPSEYARITRLGA